MRSQSFLVLLVSATLAAPTAFAQAAATEASITKELGSLRAVPDPQRPAATTKIALEIRTLPAGLPKVKLAYGLSGLATEGDPARKRSMPSPKRSPARSRRTRSRSSYPTHRRQRPTSSWQS